MSTSIVNAHTAIVIVEDKSEEMEIAVNAVKSQLGIPLDDEGQQFGLSEKSQAPLDKAGERLYKVSEKMVIIVCARDLGEAMVSFERFIGMTDKDGVKRGGAFASFFTQSIIITDLMFPGKKGNTSIQANGIEVMLMAIEYKVPIVVCSDTDHHDVSFMQPLL